MALNARIIVHTLRRWYSKLPSPLRAAWVTAVVTFIGTLLTLVTALLPELSEAITGGDFDDFYAQVAIAAKAAFAALLALAAGIVNGIFRWLKRIEQAYPDPPRPGADTIGEAHG